MSQYNNLSDEICTHLLVCELWLSGSCPPSHGTRLPDFFKHYDTVFTRFKTTKVGSRKVGAGAAGGPTFKIYMIAPENLEILLPLTVDRWGKQHRIKTKMMKRGPMKGKLRVEITNFRLGLKLIVDCGFQDRVKNWI
jgi:hypothetical protein